MPEPDNPLTAWNKQVPAFLASIDEFGHDETSRFIKEKANGFVCSKCSHIGEPFRIAKRLRVLKCRACHYESSVTAGTVMHRSKLDTFVWFWAAYLVSTQTTGISALELQKQLGIEGYETAFLVKKIKYQSLLQLSCDVGKCVIQIQIR